MAARILAKVEAEELWLELIEKARHSDKTYELASLLHYLEDRAYGKCMQPVEHSGGDKPVDITHDVGSNAANRLKELLERAARRAARVESVGAGGTDPSQRE
jgi:hypothetical protein